MATPSPAHPVPPRPPRTFLTPALLTDATGQSATAAELDAALAALHQYSLISTPTALTNGTSDGQALTVGQLVLHPLVHEVIGLTAPPGTDRTTFHTALDAHLTRTVDDTTTTGRAGWPTARLLAPHLPTLLHRTPLTDFTTTRNVLDNLADTLRGAGAAAAGQHLLRQCVLEAETHHLGPDHPDTLTSRGNLAHTLRELGRHQEAADLHQQALADCERVLGPHHPHTLTSRSNFATALYELGRHQEAADLHQQTLADRERVLGPHHPTRSPAATTSPPPCTRPPGANGGDGHGGARGPHRPADPARAWPPNSNRTFKEVPTCPGPGTSAASTSRSPRCVRPARRGRTTI